MKSIGEFMTRTLPVLAFGAVIFCTSSGRAVPIDPGDFMSAPPGTEMAVVYYQHSSGRGLYANGREIDPRAKLFTNLVMARYVRFSEAYGQLFDVEVVVPWVDVGGSGTTASLGHATGVGDPMLIASYWFVNDPANETYVAMAPYLWLPVGDYDPRRLLNPGANRWSGDLQFSGSQGLGHGFIVEASFDVQFFGDNSNYANGHKLSQNELYDLQGFLRYQLTPVDEVGVRIRHVIGGTQQVDDASLHNEIRTTQGLTTYVRWLTPEDQLLLQIGTDFSVHDGFGEALRTQMRFVHMF